MGQLGERWPHLGVASDARKPKPLGGALSEPRLARPTMGCTGSKDASDPTAESTGDGAASLLDKKGATGEEEVIARRGSVAHRAPEFSTMELGLPFDPQLIGTLTRHGIAPAPRVAAGGAKAKINQDRGMVCWPFNGTHNQALLCVFDGHGMQGERISEWCVQQLPSRLEQDRNLLLSDPADCISKTVRRPPRHASRRAARAMPSGASDG